MSTDLWITIWNTEKKYPKVSSLKKLKKVAHFERYSLTDELKDNSSMYDVWKHLKKGWDISRVADILDLTDKECTDAVDKIWSVLLDKAKEELSCQQ